VIALLPVLRELPFTDKVAVEAAPEATSVTVASVLPPVVKVTVPVGAVVPVAGLTVAVRVVPAVLAKVAGLA
jgi:hypothetical protein